MTPFQIQALSMLCAAASRGGTTYTNCRVHLIDGASVTPLTSLGTFPIDSCAGPELSQRTTAVVLGGDIYYLYNDTLVKFEPTDSSLAGSWQSVYLLNNVGYGLRNGNVYGISAINGTCNQREGTDVVKIAVPSNQVYAYLTKNKYAKLIWSGGSSGYSGCKTLFADAIGNGAVYSLNDRYVIKFQGSNWKFIPTGFSRADVPSCVMASGDFLTVLSDAGKLEVIDMSGERGFTPSVDAVFRSSTICKGNDEYFYAIDANGVLHRFRGGDHNSYSMTGWTEIHGDSVAYGISDGKLYRVDPDSNNGAPYRLGDESNWIHVWPLQDGKYVALSYAP